MIINIICDKIILFHQGLVTLAHKTSTSREQASGRRLWSEMSTSYPVFYQDSMNITELIPGDKVRLTGFGTIGPEYRRRLLSLGVTCGTEFLIIRIAPLGCPVQIEVRGTALALRKEDASRLILECI